MIINNIMFDKKEVRELECYWSNVCKIIEKILVDCVAKLIKVELLNDYLEVNLQKYIKNVILSKNPDIIYLFKINIKKIMKIFKNNNIKNSQLNTPNYILLSVLSNYANKDKKKFILFINHSCDFINGKNVYESIFFNSLISNSISMIKFIRIYIDLKVYLNDTKRFKNISSEKLLDILNEHGNQLFFERYREYKIVYDEKLIC